jgi:hypothetical protein
MKVLESQNNMLIFCSLAMNQSSWIWKLCSDAAHPYSKRRGEGITVGPNLLKYYETMEGPQKGALNIEWAQSDLGYQPNYAPFQGLMKYVESLRPPRGF